MAAQNVAKAHGHTLHLAFPCIILHQHFRYALCGAHDVCWVDGLVRGQQHKAVYAVRRRGFQRVSGAENVVFNRLRRTVLHERNVLVRSRVEQHLRLTIVHDLVETLPVAHGADQNAHRAIAAKALF